MREQETRHEGSFIATDALGNEFEIEVYREYYQPRTRKHLRENLMEPKRKMFFHNGEPVSYLAPGKLQIVATGITLTSDSPLAQ